ncbi:Uncharacterized protein FWK35_00034227, partial [Aphis craccivora]
YKVSAFCYVPSYPTVQSVRVLHFKQWTVQSDRLPNDNDLSLNDFKYFISRRLAFSLLPHKPLKHKPPFSPTTENYILG